MIPDPVAVLWSEARAPGAPRFVWRDAVLVVVAIGVTLFEAATEPDILWRPVTIPLSVGLMALLPLRRRHPLAVLALAFGATGIVQLVAWNANLRWQGPDASAAFIVLPYALLRWGSGREIVLGLPIWIVSFTAGVAQDALAPSELAAAVVFMMFPPVLGAALRLRDRLHRQDLEQVRLRERERLARELHDTVAHHASAIAVQAQAGRAVGGDAPGAALEALAQIEEAASRSLVDMRRIVAALRDEDAARAPGPGLAEIERLVNSAPAAIEIDYAADGPLDELDAPVLATVHRIIQEAITNSVRHGRDVRRVVVRLTAAADAVTVRVADDGGAVAHPFERGYGLTGMAERIDLLGGSLDAGPGSAGGWVVDARLPYGPVS